MEDTYLLTISEDDYINMINSYDHSNLMKKKFLLQNVPKLMNIVSSTYQNYLIFQF